MSCNLIIGRKSAQLERLCLCCRLRDAHLPLPFLIEFVVFPGIHVYPLTFSLHHFSGRPDRSVPTFHPHQMTRFAVIAHRKLMLMANSESRPKSCN